MSSGSAARPGPGDFAYPDAGDRLTLELIRTHEPYEGYWEESERGVLELALADLSRVVAEVESPRMLDAGAGYGRMLTVFEPLFDQVTVVEPDAERLAGAKAVAAAGGLGGKVRFLQQRAEAHESREPYAFILCSHVLQHVHTESVVPMLRRFAELLSPDGRLLVLASHSTLGRDYFVEADLRDGELIEREIDEACFNALTGNRQGLLPIRFLTRSTIEGLLAEAGLDTVRFRSFHVIDDGESLPAGIERDAFVNASASRQAKHGRDMAVMAALRQGGRGPQVT